ncbi:MAG TPA: hypothetical protein VMX17_14635 [Candidatus Glassbacteria bacterium]|nr:hypothetical protein [Candidatus Glassbacteria bacterium]
MEKVKQKKGESRKKYLVRVAVAMLEENAGIMENIKYDGAECDASCLADDLRIEFNLTEPLIFDEDEVESGVLVIPKKSKKKKSKKNK